MKRLMICMIFALWVYLTVMFIIARTYTIPEISVHEPEIIVTLMMTTCLLSVMYIEYKLNGLEKRIQIHHQELIYQLREQLMDVIRLDHPKRDLNQKGTDQCQKRQ